MVTSQMAARVHRLTAEERLVYAVRAEFTDTLPGAIHSGERIRAISNPARQGAVLCYVPGTNWFPNGYLIERYENGTAAGWPDWLPAWDVERCTRREHGHL